MLLLTSTTREAAIGKASVALCEFRLGGDAVALRPADGCVAPYLMHLMNAGDFESRKMACVNGTTVRHLGLGKLLEIAVVLPPLPIQHLVVSTLDKLNDYANSLSVGLPAEIDARSKQYEWWRNRLLSFRGKSD